MLFQSFQFIVFLFFVFIIYWRLPQKFRWGFMLSCGYFFYMLWDVRYMLLLMLVTLVTYYAGIVLEKSNAGLRKGLFVLCCIFETGILIVFKILNLFQESVIIPVGISFYMFQTLGYVADVYMGRIKAEKHLGYYAESVAFFPILLSGPIERIPNLTSQFRKNAPFSYETGCRAFELILFGYFKKLIVADSLAVYVDKIYENVYAYSGLALLGAVILYSIEIYCDFSGYSDIATGVAGLFGIRVCRNFQRPYLAESIVDFWKRWHISLTNWFRDYVYIPLGGNRVSKGKRDRNIMITFLLSGLWHGIGWNFAGWGFLHGGLQIIGRKRKDKRKRTEGLAVWNRIKVFIVVSMLWVLFRSSSLAEAWYVLSHCLHGILRGRAYLESGGMPGMIFTVQNVMVLFFIFIIFLLDWKEEKHIADREQSICLQSFWGRSFVVALLTVSIFYYMRYGTDGSAFIYFQF